MLCTLDDRDLRLERLKWRSQREQYAKQYQQALAQRNAALAQIITAQIAQAEAELALVEEHLERSQLRAPFDSLVVSGDLSQSIGAPVERGKVLFEVAPLEAYRVILEVDERDIAEVADGQEGHLVLSAFPNAPLPFTVTTVTPVSTARAGRNYFRVEARLTHTSARLRPGMEGIGKIAIDRRLLLWIWTHQAVDWLRLQLWSWLPREGCATMSEVLFSSAWYRVAALRPRLRRHAQIHRHHYRAALVHPARPRFTTPLSLLASGVLRDRAMDGKRTVEALWEVASTRLGDDAPTQDEVIQLLTHLHAADMLQCDVPRTRLNSSCVTSDSAARPGRIAS